MDSKKSKKGNKERDILSGDGGLKDILQLLKEQSKKKEKLGMALKVIQDGTRQDTPTTVKTSVGEAAEVLGSLFNTHECLMKSGVEIQKRLESHPATKKWGSSRDHVRRLYEIPQKARRRGRKGHPPPSSGKNS